MKQHYHGRSIPLVAALVTSASILVARAADPKVHSFDLAGARSVPFNVQFTSDLKGCAIAGTNETLQLREMQNGSILAEVPTTPEAPDAQPTPIVFAFIPTSGQVVVGRAASLAVHDPRTGARLRPLEPAPHRIGSIQVSPDGLHAVANPVYLVPADLTFWNLTNGHALRHLPTDKPPGGYNSRTMPGPSMPAIPIPQWMGPQGLNTFASTGHRFFRVLEGSSVDAWDLDQAKCLGTWHPGPMRGHASAVVALDDHRVAVAVGDFELRVVDPIANTKVVWIAGNPIKVATAFHIRDLALSGDGRRLAVAGMRMKSRRGVMAPAGDMVYDVPLHGEVQLWDVASAKVLTTFRGRPTEMFVKVALNQTGDRIAAVHNGVSIRPNWTSAMQQAYSRNPTEPLRVTVWDLPGGN